MSRTYGTHSLQVSIANWVSFYGVAGKSTAPWRNALETNKTHQAKGGRCQWYMLFLLVPSLVAPPDRSKLFRSIGVLPSTIFTPYHLRWPHRSHRRQGSLTRFDAIRHGEVRTARLYILARGQRPRATSTRECYLPPLLPPRPCLSPVTTALPSPRHLQNSILAMV